MLGTRRCDVMALLAGAALAQAVLLHCERHVPPAAYELHPFLEITPLSTSRSRLKSAIVDRRAYLEKVKGLRLLTPSKPKARRQQAHQCGFR